VGATYSTDNAFVSAGAVAGAGPYDRKKIRLVAQLKAAQSEVRLGKSTSNLFRDRKPVGAAKLDVRAFNEVLDIDSATRTLGCEGMTSYDALVDAALARGLLPAVVPQLKSITVGGALAGLGIEASSFRYGLAHETAEEIEVLLADGDVVVCTPHNEHRDLFFGFPNSYGTLGYALRLRVGTLRVKR